MRTVFCLFSILLIIFACSKDEQKKTSYENQMIDNSVNAALSARTEGEIKAEYELLTPSEKDIFWRLRVEEWLVTYQDSITTAQGDFIDSVLSTISPEIFDTTTAEFAEYMSSAAQQISARAAIVLGKYAYDLFTLDVDESSGIKCQCSTQSDWCSYTWTCLANNACTQTRNCGWLLQYICNGRCAK
jgi:hypothetical protein